MRFTEHPEPGRMHTLELTRANLTDLLAKLDQTGEPRTIIDPSKRLMVSAVEAREDYTEARQR
jgi:hypothetical protein